MSKQELIKELFATLWDWVQCGDLPGHLQIWWFVVRGRVTPETSAAEVCKMSEER